MKHKRVQVTALFLVMFRHEFRLMKTLVVFLLFALYACSHPNKKKHLQNGRQLARVHCSTCHQFPEPELLDRKTWISAVLPRMGSLMGFRHFESMTYFENDYAPSNIDLKEWNNIVQFYSSTAPDSLEPISGNLPIIDDKRVLFNAISPDFNVIPPLTTYAGIFTAENEIIFCDGLNKRLYTMIKMNLVDSFEIETGASQVWKQKNILTVLSMGVLTPSDIKSGKLVQYHGKIPTIILDSLQRPVYAEFANLNNDFLQDILICEFGNNTGQLSWFEQEKVGGYKKHILKASPGAIKTFVRDFNKDGLNDIMVLMAQADEGVFIFYNTGRNIFREERVLQFPPAYGSNYFELTDVNKDGFEDIIATNGDNGDFSPILKPYHGIRIYLNNGSNQFKQQIFLPVNGVCKAICRDFDNDGDPDIASIAYFPDYYHRPYESFIYWENNGNLNFTPRSVPSALNGRWLVMDAGDVDNDGDQDILLGNAIMGMGRVPDFMMKRWNVASSSILVLENLLHSRD